MTSRPRPSLQRVLGSWFAHRAFARRGSQRWRFSSRTGRAPPRDSSRSDDISQPYDTTPDACQRAEAAYAATRALCESVASLGYPVTNADGYAEQLQHQIEDIDTALSELHSLVRENLHMPVGVLSTPVVGVEHNKDRQQ